MNKIDKWLKNVEERQETRKELNVYHINFPMTMFELDELEMILKEYKELKEKEQDDGK